MRANQLSDLRQSVRASLSCDMPRVPCKRAAIVSLLKRTVRSQLRKVPFEVIYGREKDFQVEEVFLGYLNCFQVLAVTCVSLNVCYTRRS